MDADLLTRRLQTLEAGRVSVDRTTLEAHAVDGVMPLAVCHPADAEQVASLLRICGELAAAVAPWGGGTSMALGNIPHRVDVVLVLDHMNRLIEHDDANLTATVQAGMPLAALAEHLRPRGQFLALDPPRSAQATIGGVLAANTNGPRRMAYGGVRDLVIGMKMVLPTGEQVKAGGKVVKNVAGYDMCKLFVGSLGTLGIITEATLKMAPLPERAATVTAAGTVEAAVRAVDGLFASMLQPSAVALLGGDAAGAVDERHPALLAVGIEGFSEVVERHVQDISAIAAVRGLSIGVRRGDAHEDLWTWVRDFPCGDAHEAVLRVTLPLGAVGQAVAALGGASYVAHAGSGTIWLRVEAARAREVFADLAARVRIAGGHAVMAAAPAPLKRDLDVWGPPPAALEIMREIKRQFDPHRLLNPGRFVAFL